MIGVLNADFIRTRCAPWGLSDWTIYVRYGLRKRTGCRFSHHRRASLFLDHASAPTCWFERVFGWPGIGGFALNAPTSHRTYAHGPGNFVLVDGAVPVDLDQPQRSISAMAHRGPARTEGGT